MKSTGLFLAGLFFTLANAFATSFGPIPVVDQAIQSQYYVRGRVIGSSWTMMARREGQPYTYWRISISEQLMGENIGSEIVVRQPGGDIGERGYRMAGVAELSEGEDVFMPLHDVDDRNGNGLPVKEIVGLASGKYRVMRGANGKPFVENGLGIPVAGAGNRLLSPTDFAALIRRAGRGQATEEDKNIFVNRTTVHEHEHDEGLQAAERERQVREILAMQRRPAEASKETATLTSTIATQTQINSPNAVQENPAPTEENSTGSSSWIFAAVIVLGLLFGLVMVLRR